MLLIVNGAAPDSWGCTLIGSHRTSKGSIDVRPVSNSFISRVRVMGGAISGQGACAPAAAGASAVGAIHVEDVEAGGETGIKLECRICLTADDDVFLKVPCCTSIAQ